MYLLYLQKTVYQLTRTMLSSLLFLFLYQEVIISRMAMAVVVPTPTVGYLVSVNASLMSINGSRSDYYVQNGTVFKLQPEPYRIEEFQAFNLSFSNGLSGIFASKEQVVLTPTFLDNFVYVPEGTLFDFYRVQHSTGDYYGHTISAAPMLFRTKPGSTLYSDGTGTFEVPSNSNGIPTFSAEEAFDEATLKFFLYEDEDEPEDLQGYLFGKVDLLSFKYDQYYIPYGTVLTLSPKDDKSLTAVKSTEEAAQQELGRGFLHSKERVTLIPKNDSEVLFIVPEKTLFNFFSNESGECHIHVLIVEEEMILHRNSSDQFTVSVEKNSARGVQVREVKAKLSVVLSYYFQVNITDSHFSPENIKESLEKDFRTYGFKSRIYVFCVILDQPQQSTPQKIGLTVTIYDATLQPREVQESLQHYFNHPVGKLEDRDPNNVMYKVLPPPYWET